ncbi:hypothetical protein LK533_06240 [Sphingomonas sp. PL-96]|uniref:hypothetical protein n=1 Tax=Sphingomonas sp. PL-96 TaxID=2887201 RepID=UPI001E646F86|nr:hypothetical protein [Sphingomonas sp. PL-96]MCC2976273.1 hypothetical protein [Sphingomonas sp. PL-96]
MQRDDDLRYFYGRAQLELNRAQRATDPAASKAHYRLADCYLAQGSDRCLTDHHGR